MSPLAAVALLAAAADVPPVETRRDVSGSVAGYYYLVPSAADALVAIGSIEVGRTHLEARYGYEDLRTGSAFVGHRFDLSIRDLELAITPIVGGVFGRTRGVAPGLELSARLGKVELTSEIEYVIDGSQPDASFLYSWSELVVRPIAWLQAGLAVQRTRFFRESRLVEPGAVVGCTFGAFTTKAYAFEPFGAGRFYAFALEASL